MKASKLRALLITLATGAMVVFLIRLSCEAGAAKARETFKVQSKAEPHPSLPAIGSLDGLGVNVHFTDPKPGELEMIKAAGFKWVRMDLSWGATERTTGEYNFTAYDRLSAALDKNGLRAVFILDYGNKLYDEGLAPHTDEGRAAFAQWAVAAVGHFKGKGYLWELWNEPNIAQFWKPKPDVQQYIALAKTVCVQLRSAKLTPGECLIGPATSTVDLRFLEECFKAGLLESFDGVSVHPYRQKPPETVEEDYRAVRVLIRRYAPKSKEIPVLSGEWGYSTAWPSLGKDDGSREENQAKYLTRMFLTNISNDVPLSIWYDWRDDGDDPKEGEHRFGIVRRKYRDSGESVFEPKAAYQAMKTLAGQLEGHRFSKRLLIPAGEPPYASDFSRYMLLFAKARNPRVAVWQARRIRTGDTLTLPATAGKFRLLNWNGLKEDELSNLGERLTVPSDDGPIFVSTLTSNECLETAVDITRVPLDFVFTWPLNRERADGSSWRDLKLIVPNRHRHKLIIRQGFSSEFPISPGASFEDTDNFLVSRRAFSLDEKWVSLVFSAGKVVGLSQATGLICTNPLSVEALTATATILPLRLSNPTGEALSASIAIGSGNLMGESVLEFDTAVSLKRGQTDLLIPVPLKRPVRWYDEFSVSLYQPPRKDFYDGEARCVWETYNLCQDPLPAFTSSHLKVFPDGEQLESQVHSVEDAPGFVDPSGLGSAVRLRYRFPRGFAFARCTPDPRLFPPMEEDLESIPRRLPPDRLGLWLHGDSMRCQTRIRFRDKTGQVFQSDGPLINFHGWRYVTFSMKSNDRELAHWGGANDGEIHYPIQWDSIVLLDNVSKEPVEGEIYISAPTLFY